jgi:hypothetical protein
VKKYIFPLLVIFAIALSFLSVPVARARPLTDCSGTCLGYIIWNDILPSGTHGAQTDFTIDNPSGVFFNWYDKYLAMENSHGDYIQVGIDNNNFCVSGLHYFYLWHDAQTSSGGITCSTNTVDSKDVNNLATFAISYYTSNGGGGYAWLKGTKAGDNLCPNGCAIADGNFTADWNKKWYEVDINDSSFVGHEVWGGHWENNYRFVNGTWSYLTSSDGTGTRVHNDPVQIFWNSNPNGSTNKGGDVWSCVYPNGSSCTIGS